MGRNDILSVRSRSALSHNRRRPRPPERVIRAATTTRTPEQPFHTLRGRGRLVFASAPCLHFSGRVARSNEVLCVTVIRSSVPRATRLQFRALPRPAPTPPAPFPRLLRGPNAPTLDVGAAALRDVRMGWWASSCRLSVYPVALT